MFTHWNISVVCWAWNMLEATQFKMIFKQFLETSTIHGLVHIASKKNLGKTDWLILLTKKHTECP